MVQLVLKV
jgi:hypothetical protein